MQTLCARCDAPVKRKGNSWCSSQCWNAERQEKADLRRPLKLCEAGCGTLTRNNRFCRKSCSARVTNSEAPRRVRYTVAYTLCVGCEKELPKVSYTQKYCDPACAKQHKQRQKLESWVAGTYTKRLRRYLVRLWLIETYGHFCAECGREGVYHPITGLTVLEIDHIDGDRLNTVPDNVRLLCGWCHRLTDTWGWNSLRQRQKDAV